MCKTKDTHLFQCCAGQVRLQHDEAILLLSQVPHVSIALPVVQGHCGQIVERCVQVVGDMSYEDRRYDESSLENTMVIQTPL